MSGHLSVSGNPAITMFALLFSYNLPQFLPGNLGMLTVLLLQLLVVLECDPLPVPHDADPLTGSRLPQSDAHLVTPAENVLVVQTPGYGRQSLHSLGVVDIA